MTTQIPAEVKRDIVTKLEGFDMQTGAIHAIEEVEQWLADNNLIITKEEPCVSQSPEPEAPSEDISSTR